MGYISTFAEKNEIEKDSKCSLITSGKLFQTRGAAAAKEWKRLYAD